jgi:hypothetical protein
MANLTKGGFRPWGTITGGEGVFPSPMRREVANNYATSIFQGDIIIPVNDGTVAVSANNSTTLLGVAIGFSYYISGKRWPKPYLPANTTFTPTTVGSNQASYVTFVPLTSDLILEVDADDGTTVTTLAAAVSIINENCNLSTGSGGDTTTGISSMAMSISSHTTSAAQFRVIGISGYPLENWTINQAVNDPTLTRAKYLVVCNQGFLPPYTTSGV